MPDRDAFEQLRVGLMQLYSAGDFAAALALVQKNEADFPEQAERTMFWKMCLLSMDGRLDEALSTFRQSLDDGMWWAERQFVDTDLDPLRELPEFKELVARSMQAWEQGRKHVEREHILVLTDAPAPYPLLIVLHGRNGDKETALECWEFAKEMGWAILSAQSTQPLFPGSYCWDDPVTGMQDIQFYLEKTLKAHPVDPDKILVGGFSQGSGMALYAALSGAMPVRGFIVGATWWQDVDSLAALAAKTKDVKGYFVSGGKDYTLERAREIQAMLKEHNIPFEEEFHPNLGHEFPEDFETSFARSLEFIFKE
jgi:predicted esterase